MHIKAALAASMPVGRPEHSGRSLSPFHIHVCAYLCLGYILFTTEAAYHLT